jgi:nucleotide-binding universal stress UspA family protein
MSMQLKTLVVGVGSIHERDPALTAAAAVARRAGAKLHAVHAFALPEPMLDAYARMGYLDSGVFTRYGTEFQLRLERLVREVAEGIEVESHALAGAAREVVCEVARDAGADLIILGASHGGALSRLFLGSTAESVIRTATVPVLVLRARPDPAPKRVLITTDLSPMSAHVHDVGLELADIISGPAELVTKSLLVVAYDTVLPPPLRRELLDEAAKTEHARFLSQRTQGQKVTESKVRFGDPAREIVAEAEAWEADLVVLGTHARRGIEKLLLGSVAGSVLRAAPCNALIIPAVATSESSGGVTGQGSAVHAATAPSGSVF